jgi:hypothetical protein
LRAGLSKTEVLELIRWYVDENNITTPFRGGGRDDYFFIRLKNATSEAEKSRKVLKDCRKQN